MLLGKTFRQESIATWTRKRYIDDAALVHVPDLRASETEFSAAKVVRVNRYLRPRGSFVFLPLLDASSSENVDAPSVPFPRTVG